MYKGDSVEHDHDDDPGPQIVGEEQRAGLLKSDLGRIVLSLKEVHPLLLRVSAGQNLRPGMAEFSGNSNFLLR